MQCSRLHAMLQQSTAKPPNMLLVDHQDRPECIYAISVVWQMWNLQQPFAGGAACVITCCPCASWMSSRKMLAGASLHALICVFEHGITVCTRQHHLSATGAAISALASTAPALAAAAVEGSSIIQCNNKKQQAPSASTIRKVMKQNVRASNSIISNNTTCNCYSMPAGQQQPFMGVHKAEILQQQ